MSSTQAKGVKKHILVDNQEGALYEEVEALLESGWKLYGYPFSHNSYII